MSNILIKDSGKRLTYNVSWFIVTNPLYLKFKKINFETILFQSKKIYISFIYELMHRLFLERSIARNGDKIEKLRQYIRYNYMENLRVSALAHSFGFERSYLYRIFKNRYGVGIKEYITEVRMEYAGKFLSDGYTVSESAHMVGYDDEFNFSKSFKRRFGVSPSELRARAREGKS